MGVKNKLFEFWANILNGQEKPGEGNMCVDLVIKHFIKESYFPVWYHGFLYKQNNKNNVVWNH